MVKPLWNFNARYNWLVFASMFLLSFGMLAHTAFADTVAYTINTPGMPFDVAVNPMTNMIYVPDGGNYNGGHVIVVNGSTNSVVAIINVGNGPVAAAVNPNTNLIYVSTEQSGAITVINGSTNSVVATIAQGISTPQNIAVNPNTNRIYVVNEYDSTLSVIDGSSNSVISTIPVGSTFSDVTVNPITNMIYVADHSRNTVAVIDGSTNSVVTTIAAGNHPTTIDVNPNTDKIYVSNGTEFFVINGTSNNVSSILPIHTSDVAVNPNTNKVYVSDGSNGVYVINGTTDTVITNVSTGSSGHSTAVNPQTNKIYEGNPFSYTVTVIDGSNSQSAAPDTTSTSLSLDPQIISGGGQTTVTATISDTVTPNNTPTGTVSFADNGAGGKFGGMNCYNSNSMLICSASYTAPNATGTITITGSYGGDSTHNTSSGTASLRLKDYTSTNVSVNPPSVNVRGQTTFSAIVSDTANSNNTPTGTLQFSINSVGEGSSPSPESCTISGSNLVCSLQFIAPSTPGTYTVTGYYFGDSTHNTSSGTATLTVNATVPNSPTGLTATAASSVQINLSWTAPSNNGGSQVTGYMIQRSTDGGATWSNIVSNSGSTSTAYSDTGLAASKTYTYQVSAINSVGTSSPSNTASATTSGVTIASGIVLNNVQSTSGTTSSSNQITLSGFNAGTGSNQLLIVGISANNNSPVYVTFNGMPLTHAVGSFYNNDAELWYLKNPSGTGNIVVTMGGSTQAVVGAYSFSGVSQTSPIPATATGHNTSVSSPAISITTKYANDLVLDLPSIWGGVTLGSPTCMQQWDANVPNAITGASSSTMVQSPAAVACKWTASSADFWDDVAVELKAVG